LKSELDALEELQSLDLETLEVRKELKAIPENLEAMRSEVEHIGSLLEKEKQRLKEAEEWRLERDKDISAQNTLLGKSKNKLQSVRNEKEQKAAQREIETIRKNIQDREEEAIKVMEAVEQYRSAIEDHTREFAELEAHLRASEEESKARMIEVESIIGKGTERRNEIASKISPGTLRLYDRIRKRLGRAVVEAKDGFCLGCNMEILAQTYNELQRCDKIYQCVNCFRILIFKPQTQDVSENTSLEK
jgi:predicted  nucleic acid-binding Zn-ribbon protein